MIELLGDVWTVIAYDENSPAHFFKSADQLPVRDFTPPSPAQKAPVDKRHAADLLAHRG